MTFRIEVGLRDDIDDPRGAAALRGAREYLGLAVDQVRSRTVYKIAFDLEQAVQRRVCEALTDPVIEESALGRLPLPACDWVIAVGFRPGVTDNVGRTAAVFVRDLLGRSDATGSVFTETHYLLRAPALGRDDVRRLAHELLANALIERIGVWSADAYAREPLDLELPLADQTIDPRAEAVPLPESDEALLELSRQRLLALSAAEMRAIREHYAAPAEAAHRRAQGLPPHPTDVELEALAQTWSEHCKHKIFNARIDYVDERGVRQTIHSLFKSYIVEATRRVSERVDWLVSVFDDNAGVVQLDDELNLVYKVETHNSPSALDPYGGAITGIVGVNRDPFGTGLGAALLTNVWGYCLGPPDYAETVPEGLLHPRRIRDGVHRGVIDGGNQSGIPYSRGWELFDERFVGKPLVFCGTVGTMPARVAGGPSEQKSIEPGDLVVMVGGRIGKDGIHGATFSSEALHGESPAQAVQIGDPITQKMMTDMLLEARDQGLYRAITDNGAGGLSSSVGEIARLSGGAELELDRAPLKYAGLMPWEILLSEAQERMTIAVPPQRLDALLELARRREVEATVIGRFNDDGRLRARFRGELVADLEMAFLHEGCPVLELEARWAPAAGARPSELGIEPGDEPLDQLLLALCGRLNIRSKERLTRQYDHEVKGLSVIKPLVGRFADVPADATVMRVQHGRDAAILLAEGVAPRLSDIDAGAMAGWVVDLAVRRIIAGGGRLGYIAGLDNFCWPDPVQSEQTPDGRHKLAQLVRCCQQLSAMTVGLDLPLISGKDSMKNDSVRGGVKISIPPTLLFSVLGWIEDARRAIDLVVPEPDHEIFLVGETGPELGASEICALVGQRRGQPLVGGEAPSATPQRTRQVCQTVERGIQRDLVSAAHAPHLGGLALGLTTLTLASGLGIEATLDGVPRRGSPDALALLFAESTARLLVAARPDRAAELTRLFDAEGVAWTRLGHTCAAPHLRLSQHGRTLVELPLDRLRERFAGRSD